MLGLTEEQVEFIVKQAQAGAPEEVCGILGGLGGEVLAIYPAVNVAANRRFAYNLDPYDLLRIFEELEAQGRELIGIYHSHPAGPSGPSATDLRQAHADDDLQHPLYPEAFYLIVSLAEPTTPSVRAFRLITGHFQEVAINITAKEGDS